MLDNIRPYKMIFIQKASPNVGDAFDFAYIYKFYSNRKDICQRLKYIVRVEVTNDIFAIKFYAARDKKLDNKYNRILKMHNYTETRSHTDGFQRNNAKCLDEKGISRFVPHSSI